MKKKNPHAFKRPKEVMEKQMRIIEAVFDEAKTYGWAIGKPRWRNRTYQDYLDTVLAFERWLSRSHFTEADPRTALIRYWKKEHYEAYLEEKIRGYKAGLIGNSPSLMKNFVHAMFAFTMFAKASESYSGSLASFNKKEMLELLQEEGIERSKEETHALKLTRESALKMFRSVRPIGIWGDQPKEIKIAWAKEVRKFFRIVLVMGGRISATLRMTANDIIVFENPTSIKGTSLTCFALVYIYNDKGSLDRTVPVFDERDALYLKRLKTQAIARMRRKKGDGNPPILLFKDKNKQNMSHENTKKVINELLYRASDASKTTVRGDKEQTERFIVKKMLLEDGTWMDKWDFYREELKKEMFSTAKRKLRERKTPYESMDEKEKKKIHIELEKALEKKWIEEIETMDLSDGRTIVVYKKNGDLLTEKIPRRITYRANAHSIRKAHARELFHLIKELPKSELQALLDFYVSIQSKRNQGNIMGRIEAERVRLGKGNKTEHEFTNLRLSYLSVSVDLGHSRSSIGPRFYYDVDQETRRRLSSKQ